MQVFTQEEVKTTKKIYRYWQSIESQNEGITFRDFLWNYAELEKFAEESQKDELKPTYTENLDKYVELTDQLFDVQKGIIEKAKENAGSALKIEILTGYETFSRIYLQAIELQKKNKDSK